MTRIAVDAMGGDHAPREIVEGAVWAAHEYGVAIELVGMQNGYFKEDKMDESAHNIAILAPDYLFIALPSTIGIEYPLSIIDSGFKTSSFSF